MGQGLVLLDNSGSEIAIVGNPIGQSRVRYMLPLTECKHDRLWVWNKEQDVWEHCTDMLVPRHEARTASIGDRKFCLILKTLIYNILKSP